MSRRRVDKINACGRGKASPATATPAGFCWILPMAASGRKIRKEEILRSAGKLACLRISPRPPRMSPGTIGDEGAPAPADYPMVYQ